MRDDLIRMNYCREHFKIAKRFDHCANAKPINSFDFPELF